MLRVAAQGIGCINNKKEKKPISDDENQQQSRVESPKHQGQVIHIHTPHHVFPHYWELKKATISKKENVMVVF